MSDQVDLTGIGIRKGSVIDALFRSQLAEGFGTVQQAFYRGYRGMGD
jgi:hypothetical protein